MTNDQLAHDLAMVYLNNRYGADVVGRFSVSTFEGDVSGSGSVETDRLPNVDKVLIERVPTGEKRFGIFDKTVAVESGYEVDATFNNIISDYFVARDRFTVLLADRHAAVDPTR